ncbi:hypothetical protein BPTFM16_02014 [Altererythrobacter insulae]|nr:hypothetical protein BPTFM16_02014 [Altererythrobacter insulae]
MKLSLNQIVRSVLIPVALGTIIVTPAHAQADVNYQEGQTDHVQLRFGLVIPFGSSGQSTELKPRVALSIVRQNKTRQTRYDWRQPANTQNATEFGLTLDEEPTFTLDGKPLRAPHEQYNLSAGALVAIGAATLVAFIAIAAAETSDALKSGLGNN